MTFPTPAFRFIDLFAGVGGFHAALKALGGECVYAVEIDKDAAAVYERNWGHKALGDITKDADRDQGLMNVPARDVLAAGFPCQPFSKSGAQRGMDETPGTLFFNIASIIEAHHPCVVLLENVREPGWAAPPPRVSGRSRVPAGRGLPRRGPARHLLSSPSPTRARWPPAGQGTGLHHGHLQPGWRREVPRPPGRHER